MMGNTEDRYPREYTYAMAIATLLMDAAGRDRLAEKRFEALKASWTLVEYYAEERFDPNLLDAIMEKKSKLILEATSAKDLLELSRPPKPWYNGSKWCISRNSVPEEELICWSITSLLGPLPDVAANRFFKLFEEFYEINIKDLDELK